MNDIVIIDYGMGNLNSVKRKLARLGIEACISFDVSVIRKASKLILPGVGHFEKAIKNLKKLGIMPVLNEKVLRNKTPILGICLGMQLMAKRSEEGCEEGFGWFDADVVKFKVNNYLTHKIPHTGWNQIHQVKSSLLMKGIPNLSEFYFVHAYHFKCHNPDDILNETEYDHKFVSAVEKENIFGVQYHPEKSHTIGEDLLKNFILL